MSVHILHALIIGMFLALGTSFLSCETHFLHCTLTFFFLFLCFLI
jgi:hypothetical protein